MQYAQFHLNVSFRDLFIVIMRKVKIKASMCIETEICKTDFPNNEHKEKQGCILIIY